MTELNWNDSSSGQLTGTHSRQFSRNGQIEIAGMLLTTSSMAARDFVENFSDRPVASIGVSRATSKLSNVSGQESDTYNLSSVLASQDSISILRYMLGVSSLSKPPLAKDPRLIDQRRVTLLG